MDRIASTELAEEAGIPVATEEQNKEWLSPTDLAEEIGIPVATLAQWRHRGIGPEYARMGKHVRYSRPAVTAYYKAQTVSTGHPVAS